MLDDNNQGGDYPVNLAPSTPPVLPPEQPPVNPYFAPSVAETIVPQPAPPAAVTPVPEQTPKVARTPLSKKKKLILAAVAAALVLIGGGLWFFLVGPGSESALERAFRENSPYEYKAAKTNVDTTQKFEFTHNLKPKEGDYFAIDEVDQYLAVYSDAALTKKANADVFIYTDPNTIDVVPTEHVDALDPVAGEDIRISNDGEWGLHEQYYIVQYVDLQTGEVLKKPIVTPFSTKKDIETPIVSFKTDEQGTPQFSWTPIEGATQYYIVKLADGFTDNTIIGQTEDSEWTYEQKDELFSDGNTLQNQDFFDARYSDDDLLNEDTRKEAQEAVLAGQNISDPDVNYGVIASNDERFSSIGSVDVDTLKAQLPHAEAFNTSVKMGIPHDMTIDTFDQIPTHMPITMADKTTTLRSITIDTSKVAKKDRSIFIVGQGFIRTIEVPYTIQGTKLSGTYKVTQFNDATYNAEIAAIVERNSAAQDKTGQIAAAAISERPNVDALKVSKTKPNVPYKINATNPLSEYLAANMLNGEEYIDVSAFVTETNPVSPMDAFFEATSQNPYILLHVSGSMSYLADKQIFVVRYDESRDDMAKEQKAIDDEVKRVVSSVIKQGMSETQKVQAINDYIVTSASYNYDALHEASDKAVTSALSKYRNSWTPSGILFDKTAVCGGYAEAFKVLADAAGLQSVYVTGLANGERHAWNKVKVDGAWRMIDTTWNDGGDKSDNDYFLLTDAQASAKRTNKEDKEWIADALISNYAGR